MTAEFENDFWKNKIRSLLYDNMKRGENSRLDMGQYEQKIREFNSCHKNVYSEYEKGPSFISWVIELDSRYYLRMLFQNMTKLTFAERTLDENVKIADAKLFNSPFIDLDTFILNFEDYKKELQLELAEENRLIKLQKLNYEIVRALLKRKFRDKNVVWNLSFKNRDFELKVTLKGEVKSILISSGNFKSEIESLDTESYILC